MVVCSNNWCNKEFENYLEDQELLKKFDIQNSMKICPTCRHINRASFKFTIFLHKRKSDLSKKSLFSIFHPENPFPVYDIDEWWSDDYAPYKYGRNFDFNKTFFEQFQTLHNEVPKLARIISKSENCDFAPYASNCKNVYYSNGIFSSQNIFFSDTITNQSNNICDSVRCFQSSYLYASTECLNTHYSAFVENCHNSRELYFCYDMLGSSNCIFSSNLRNKEYFAFNKFVGKDDFENIKNKYLDGSYKTHLECLRLYERVKAEAFTVATAQSNCENCRGHNLLQSFNSFECYHCRNLNSSRYCIHVGAGGQNINSMDLTNGGIGELIYNSCSVGGGNYFLRMCLYCRYSSFLTYCIDCYHSNNCFASVGLKKGTYTILNKTYLKSEYIDLTKKIVSHLKATGEWGGIFSKFNFNCSI